jgi:hypothetical protein
MIAGVLTEIPTWHLPKTSQKLHRLSQFPYFDALNFQQGKKSINQFLQTCMQKFYSSIVYKTVNKFQMHCPVTIFTRITERKQTTANGRYYEQQAITDRVVSL